MYPRIPPPHPHAWIFVVHGAFASHCADFSARRAQPCAHGILCESLNPVIAGPLGLHLNGSEVSSVIANGQAANLGVSVGESIVSVGGNTHIVFGDENNTIADLIQQARSAHSNAVVTIGFELKGKLAPNTTPDPAKKAPC